MARFDQGRRGRPPDGVPDARRPPIRRRPEGVPAARAVGRIGGRANRRFVTKSMDYGL